ncbi:MAG: 4-hydroxy-tetrahydrodipicolinate reductase [Rhodanobacteraceae bacterium]|nr:MAG: 4-hydroxy-tetrahydrodipicolinate reductase [Rhodanobacteraceae bacterium]
MTEAIQLAISGATGRMGRVLQDLLRDETRFQLAAKLASDRNWRAAPALDVVVDFSAPAGFDAALAHCRQHGIALVSGTTGLDAAQRSAIADAAHAIPILCAANFSLGIAVLTRLLHDAAAILPGWDLEILEAHHAGKIDAPSGTALALGRAAAAARGQDFDAVASLSRARQAVPRQAGSIGFAALRAGDIVGEHTALLAAAGERLELTHRATDRAIFARGALAAAAWISGKPAGLYSLDDVLAYPGA